MVGAGATPSFPWASPAKPLAPPSYSVSCLGDSKRYSKLLFGQLLGPSVSPSGLLWLMETMDMVDLDSCLQTSLITPHTSLPQIPDNNDDAYLIFVDFGALPHYLALKCA